MSAMPRPRSVVAAAALGAVVMTPALVGCGNDDDGASTTVPTAATSPVRTSTTTTPGDVAPTTAPTPAADVDLADVSVRLTEVASVRSPTALVPRSGTDDLFVAERAGVVRRLARAGDAFEAAAEPVLDITDAVADAGGERGLLGLAFSPDGAHLVVSYTDGDDDGASVVARYTMDADVADVASRVEILRLPQPFPNHNGGDVAFGPDGYLYLGFGDGGSQGDPDDNGQDLGSLLAKLLRIDVSASTAAAPYTVPADNPFVGDASARNEIWAFGLRNPWRFGFDTATGDLWIADVGGSEWEEVDLLPAASGAGRGANLGWSLREGAHDTDKSGDRNVPMVEPIFEYSHDEGASITGGYVYRGTRVPRLRGVYLFSDYAAAELRGIRAADGALVQQSVLATTGADLSQVSTFGQDLDGEVYVVSLAGGIYRIDA